MNIVAVILANVGSIAFQGGNAFELADTISGIWSTPAALVVGDTVTIRPARFRWSTRREFDLRLGQSTGYEGSVKALGLSEPGWPKYFLARRFNGDKHSKDSFYYRLTVKPWSLTEDADGNLKQSPIPSAHRFGDLKACELGKPIHVPRFYGPLEIAVSTLKCKPVELLKAVSAATGTTLKESKHGWKFECDPAELRHRMDRYLLDRLTEADADKSDPILLTDLNLEREAVQAASDEELVAATESSPCELSMPILADTDLARAAFERIRIYSQRQDISGLKPGMYSPRQTAELLDTNRPVQLVMRLDLGTLYLRGFVKGQGTAGIQF